MRDGSSISVGRRKCFFKITFPPHSAKIAIHGKRHRLLKDALAVYPREASMSEHTSPYRENSVEYNCFSTPMFGCRDRSEKHCANHSGHLKKLTSDAGVFLASAIEHHGNDACREYVKVGNGMGMRSGGRKEDASGQTAKSATSQRRSYHV